MVAASRKRTAVLGFPASHSLSPLLHRFWMKRYGVEAEYDALDVPPEVLEARLKRLHADGYVGCNLTLPHKEAALACMDALDKTAQEAGAVNTVIVEKNGTLKGMNTDSYGFVQNIKTALSDSPVRAAVLGAGGAAKAVCLGLKTLGVREIVIANRSQPRAEALASRYTGSRVISWEHRAEALRNADILVNATSLGMRGKEALEIELELLPARAVVCDIVYTPLETALLGEARARGNKTVDGLGMLLHQAVPAFEAWFGIRPEVTEALREEMIEGL